MANYQSAPWGLPQYGQVNQPITSAPGRLPNPIGEEGYKLLKSQGGTELNFLIKQEDLLRALCNHRHGGNFDVSPDIELPHLYRCNICDELIDLHTQHDPALVKKVIDYLWAIFNSIKTNNNGVISNVVMSDLATGMLMVKHIPKMLTVVNSNLEKNVINKQNYQQQYYRGPNMQNAINMIVSGGHDYVSQFQPNQEQYWRQPQNIIEAQQAYNAAQQQYQAAAPVVYPQGQVVYQPIPFAAGSGQGQVVYQPVQAQVPYDGNYSQGAPPPTVVTYPQQQAQPAQQQYQQPQFQTAPQVPPQAAASVVPEVQVPQPAPQQQGQQPTTVNKVFKR